MRDTLRITKRALLQRINRKLRDDDKTVRSSRGAHVEIDIERGFYLLDLKRKLIVEYVDLEKLGRKLGCLKGWEKVAAS
jgi:DNA primase catalytic subunit